MKKYLAVVCLVLALLACGRDSCREVCGGNKECLEDCNVVY